MHMGPPKWSSSALLSRQEKYSLVTGVFVCLVAAGGREWQISYSSQCGRSLHGIFQHSLYFAHPFDSMETFSYSLGALMPYKQT